MPTTLLGVLPAGIALYLGGSLAPADFAMCVILALAIVDPIMRFTAFVNDVKSMEYAVADAVEFLGLPELPETARSALVEQICGRARRRVLLRCGRGGHPLRSHFRCRRDLSPRSSGRPGRASRPSRSSRGIGTPTRVGQDWRRRRAGHAARPALGARRASSRRTTTFSTCPSGRTSASAGRGRATGRSPSPLPPRAATSSCSAFPAATIPLSGRPAARSRAASASASRSPAQSSRTRPSSSWTRRPPSPTPRARTRSSDPLRAFRRERPSSLIAHRLSTVTGADQIAVVDDGEDRGDGHAREPARKLPLVHEDVGCPRRRARLGGRV